MLCTSFEDGVSSRIEGRGTFFWVNSPMIATAAQMLGYRTTRKYMCDILNGLNYLHTLVPSRPQMSISACRAQYVQNRVNFRRLEDSSERIGEHNARLNVSESMISKTTLWQHI